MINNRRIRLLVVEDEEYDVRRIRNTIKPFAHQIIIEDVVADGVSALELIKKKRKSYDVVIMDFQIAGGLSGERLIRAIKEIEPSIQIIVVTKMTINITDFDFARNLLEAGAIWYCTKYPGDIEEYIYQPTDFILSIFNAFERKQIEKERLRTTHRLEENIAQILEKKQIIGKSPAIEQLRQQIQKAAATDSTVLIQGKSGTGKELVATHIHYLSNRRFERFVPVNCGGLPSELVESELFGYTRGAFTGAHADKPGLLELAHKGTAFLDEISELPMTAQTKLLRFLEEGELDKIGRTQKLHVDVRVLAATNKNLYELVAEGRFREDLFYRLNVFIITVPELKDRPEDIPILTDYFLRKFSMDMNLPVPELTAAARERLVTYSWPGNVRELQNVIQRLLFSGKKRLDEADVLQALGPAAHSQKRFAAGVESEWPFQEILPWREMEQNLRRSYFQFVRQRSSSDAEAARRLGLAPSNFHRMLKELGLK